MPGGAFCARVRPSSRRSCGSGAAWQRGHANTPFLLTWEAEANQEVPCRSEGVIILGDLVFRTKQVAPYAKAPSIHPLKSRTE